MRGRKNLAVLTIVAMVILGSPAWARGYIPDYKRRIQSELPWEQQKKNSLSIHFYSAYSINAFQGYQPGIALSYERALFKRFSLWAGIGELTAKGAAFATIEMQPRFYIFGRSLSGLFLAPEMGIDLTVIPPFSRGNSIYPLAYHFGVALGWTHSISDTLQFSLVSGIAVRNIGSTDPLFDGTTAQFYVPLRAGIGCVF